MHNLKQPQLKKPAQLKKKKKEENFKQNPKPNHFKLTAVH